MYNDCPECDKENESRKLLHEAGVGNIQSMPPCRHKKPDPTRTAEECAELLESAYRWRRADGVDFTHSLLAKDVRDCAAHLRRLLAEREKLVAVVKAVNALPDTLVIELQERGMTFTAKRIDEIMTMLAALPEVKT
jgi:hypothetical protein